MDRTKIGSRLKELRNAKGLSQAAIANKLGISDTSYQKYEYGERDIPGKILIALSDLFDVTVDSLLCLTDINDPDAHADIENNCYVEVPLFEGIAAGTPIEMIEVQETFVIPAELKQRHPNSYLVKVKGESMNKRLPNGSFALIDRDAPVINGRAYAVCVNGFDATIKRVYKLDNGYELRPDSTDPTIKPIVYDYGIDGTDEITVLGQVVWYTVPFDFVV